MIPGRYMTKQCSNINRKRLFHSNYKSSEKARKRRKILRGAVKSGMDINEQTEGNIYEAGGFLILFKYYILSCLSSISLEIPFLNSF